MKKQTIFAVKDRYLGNEKIVAYYATYEMALKRYEKIAAKRANYCDNPKPEDIIKEVDLILEE